MGLIRSGCIKKFFVRLFHWWCSSFTTKVNVIWQVLCINDTGAQWQDQCFSTVFFTVPHPKAFLDIIFLVIPSSWETVFCQTCKAICLQLFFSQYHILFSFSFYDSDDTNARSFCHPCVLSLLFFFQPFFSLFEGWIISTEVPSSSFSPSCPSCHWIFGDSFKFQLFYFSVIQFPFGSYL